MVKTTVGWVGGGGGCEVLEAAEANDSESVLAMDHDVSR
jgi:hypothetical protein